MKLKKIIPYLSAVLLGLSGCAALDNLDELSVLGEYSREKSSQDRLVKSINDRYDLLTKVIAQGQISEYKDNVSFEHTFGGPILKEDWGNGGQRWLYRYAIYRIAKDKVYLYFNHDGKLVRWEKVPCQAFF